jgi:hypothetical protein
MFLLFSLDCKHRLTSGSVHAVEIHYCCSVCKEDVIEQSGDIRHAESSVVKHFVFSSYENLQYVSDILVSHQLKQCSNQPIIVNTVFASTSISCLARTDSKVVANKDLVYLARCLAM